MANPVGLLFRINQSNGSLMALVDSSSMSSPGDGTLTVTNVPGGVAPDAVASLVYANGALPLNWSPTARFTLNYNTLLNPPLVGVVRASIY